LAGPGRPRVKIPPWPCLVLLRPILANPARYERLCAIYRPAKLAGFELPPVVMKPVTGALRDDEHK
jgi:hypothetical protein